MKFKVCLKILSKAQISKYYIHDFLFKIENDTSSSIPQKSKNKID